MCNNAVGTCPMLMFENASCISSNIQAMRAQLDDLSCSFDWDMVS